MRVKPDPFTPGLELFAKVVYELGILAASVGNERVKSSGLEWGATGGLLRLRKATVI
jgi:hypothetical protein